MAGREIVLEYTMDELKFTGEPGEPDAVRFFSLILRRVKFAVNAIRDQFLIAEGQSMLVISLPTADKIYQGKIALVRNNGTGDDIPYICMQNNGGAYAWRQIQVV